MNKERPRIPVQTKTEKLPSSATPIVSEMEKEYGKLSFVFVAIFVISFISYLAFDGSGPFEELNQVQAFLSQFMGVFFIVFASFKFVNMKSFTHGFSMYDLIAKRSNAYAYAYPFIQLAIGIAMFVVPSLAITHFAALAVSGIALVGVANSLLNKQKIRCACLGNVIKMPLATVSAFEDGSMFIISLFMFISMIG